MGIKTPDYVLTEDEVISFGIWDEKTIPAGSFVRPIEIVYLPQHVKDRLEHRFFDARYNVYCYTKLGIVMITKIKLRKV